MIVTRISKTGLALIMALMMVAGGIVPYAYALPPTAPNLGSAINYSILAATGITCTGTNSFPLVIGSSPTATVSGVPSPCTATIDNTDAAAAQTALGAAITSVSSGGYTLVTTADLGSQNVINSGGCTTGCYTPGGYYSTSSLALSTPITLDGAGVYIFFATASTLTTSGTANVILTNGATDSNVFWVLKGGGGSATVAIATGDSFIGNILATTSITLSGATGATFDGRALANAGAVSISNAIGTFTSPPGPSTTSVICVPSSVVVGSPSTCTATVTGSGSHTPTGNVAWTQSGSGSVTFSASTCALSAGACSVTATGLSAGSVTVQGAYAGDTFNAASSGTFSLTVTIPSVPEFPFALAMPMLFLAAAAIYLFTRSKIPLRK